MWHVQRLGLIVSCCLILGCKGNKFDLALEAPSLETSGTQTSVNAFGGDVLEVRGVNLTSQTVVKIGDNTCANDSVLTPSHMRCAVPALHGVGNFDVNLLFGGVVVGTQANAIKSYAVFGSDNSTAESLVKYGYNVPFAVKKCGDRLVASDVLNSRLIVWNTVPTASYTPFDYVIGQPNAFNRSANAGSTTNAKGINTAYSFACYQNKLIVADSANFRVLIWNQFPTTYNVAADVVLGQPDMTTAVSHNGGFTATSLGNLSDVAVDKNGRLYVVDGNTGNRVLIWNSIPTVNQTAADLVLGQINFTNNTSAVSQTRVNSPLGVLPVGDRLFVSDSANRILVWNSLPTANTQAADLVLGQTLFTTSTSGTSLIKFNRPYQMSSDGTRLVVTDSNSNRLLVWNTLPTVTNQAADFVLGQPSTITNTANNPSLSNAGLSAPAGSGFIHVGTVDKLFVTENGNQRILAWDTFPTATGQGATMVLGQSSFTTAVSNSKPVTPEAFFNAPNGSFYDGQTLAVADTSNHRVLIWNSFPATLSTQPDVILGQSTMAGVSSNAGGAVSAKSLSNPRTVLIDNGKLYVVDGGNHRVLVWNSIPTSNFTNADLVLGQPNFTTGTANSGGAASASTLSGPSDVLIVGTRLYVGDSSNNRVLFWNTVPTTSSVAANGALGQSNLTNTTLNQGGISAARMRTPARLASDGTRVAISDLNNNRVLIWSTTPAAYSAADIVLGQPDGISSTANNPANNGKQKLSAPSGIAFSTTSMYVVDRANNRVLRWNIADLATNAESTEVLGQSDFNTTTAHGGSLYSLNTPEIIHDFGQGLIVTDKSNSRILLWPYP